MNTRIQQSSSRYCCTAACNAMAALAEDHLPLVAAMVRRFPPGMYEREELYQQGCVGLMKALLRYDPDSGTAFSTYAVPLILGEMRQLSRLNAPIHIPRPERETRQRIRRMYSALSVALQREPNVTELSNALRMDASELMLMMEDVSVDSSDEHAEDQHALSETIADKDDWQTRIELRDLIDHLPDQDRQLMLLRHIHGFSQAKTACTLGLTQVQVSRREAVLRRQLKEAWYGT